MQLTLSAICERVHGELVGDGNTPITGLNSAEVAQAGDITFAEDERRLASALASKASAIIVPLSLSDLQGRSGIRVAEPRLAIAGLLGLFYPEPLHEPGIHPSAVVAEGADLGAGVRVGPNAVIESGAVIGSETVVGAGTYIGHDVHVGEGCRFFPNVVIYHRTQIGNRVRLHAGVIIGADGFGYAFHQGAYHKIPQAGNVIIEDDVEVGANSCIDRSTMGSTVVRAGTKIDNLVQIGHNNKIGRHVAIAGQVGLAGSVTLGDYVRLGGKAGATDHVTVGEGVQAGVGTIITRNIPPGESVWGTPARPARKAKEVFAIYSRLPKLLQRVLGIEEQVRKQQEQLEQLQRGLGPPKQG